MNKHLIYSIAFICACTLICQVAFAKTTAYSNFSAAQLKAKMDSGEEIFLLNPLSDIMFNEKHIPGSINIPPKQLMKTELLPKDKDALIVTYCLGPK